MIASGELRGIYGYSININIEGGEIQATSSGEYGALFVFNRALTVSDNLSVKGSAEHQATVLQDAEIYSGDITFGGDLIKCGAVKTGDNFCKIVHIKEASAHKHCVCGSAENIGDHTAHSDISYQALDGDFTGGDLPAGSLTGAAATNRKRRINR